LSYYAGAEVPNVRPEPGKQKRRKKNRGAADYFGMFFVLHLRRALRGASTANLKAQSNLAATFFDLHRYSEASDTFALAVELSPNDPDLRANLGLALQKAGRSDEAKKAFAEARTLRTAAAPKDAGSN
jgi:tetratricopeptide (TPR) repeat protein